MRDEPDIGLRCLSRMNKKNSCFFDEKHEVPSGETLFLRIGPLFRRIGPPVFTRQDLFENPTLLIKRTTLYVCFFEHVFLFFL